MASDLVNRLAQILSGGAAPQQPTAAPQIPPQAPAIDPAMLYGQQPAPAGDVPMHPALQALQQHFALLNLMRNQRNQGMNDVEGVDPSQAVQ